MTNYRIKYYGSNCCSYNTNGDILLSETGLNRLTDNEQIKYLADVITHEHIHKVLHKMFDLTTCKLFDAIEQHFRKYDKLHIKSIGNRLDTESYQSFIKRNGFQAFLNHYHISNDMANQAYMICNSKPGVL